MPRILLADDDPIVLELAAGSLRAAGYDLVLVRDGASALREVRRARPDLVLLDLNLAGRDGLEVMGALQRSGHAMPVVLWSADIRDATRRAALEAGAAGFIAKPFDPLRLPATLAEMIRAPASPAASVEVAPDQLEAFRKELQHRLTTLAQGLEEGEADRREELLRLAHLITGAAGALGHGDVSALAAEVHAALTGSPEGPLHTLARRCRAAADQLGL